MNSATSPSPRPYQTEAVQAVVSTLGAGGSHALLAMAPGTGRSFTAASAVAELLRTHQAQRVLVLVHRNDRKHQWMHLLLQEVPDLDVQTAQKAKHFPKAASIVISTISMARLARELGVLPPGTFDLAVLDECEISDGMLAEEVAGRFLGLTHLADGKILERFHLEKPSFEYPYPKAVAEGYLLPFITIEVDQTIPKTLWWDPWLAEDGAHRSNPAFVSTEDWLQSACQLIVSRLSLAPFSKGKTVIIVPGKHQATSTARVLSDLLGTPDRVIALTRRASEGGDDYRRYFTADEPSIAVVADRYRFIDSPEIRTVVLMRPAYRSSSILDMVCLGARPVDGKSHFQVIDFFGNVARAGHLFSGTNAGEQP